MAAPPKKIFPDSEDDEELKSRLRLVAKASGAHSLAPRSPEIPTITVPAARDEPPTLAGPEKGREAPETPEIRRRIDNGPTLTLRGIPPELWRELNLRSVEEKTTVRALVLQALKAQGYSVPAAELEDKRKHNGARRSG